MGSQPAISEKSEVLAPKDSKIDAMDQTIEPPSLSQHLVTIQWKSRTSQEEMIKV